MQQSAPMTSPANRKGEKTQPNRRDVGPCSSINWPERTVRRLAGTVAREPVTTAGPAAAIERHSIQNESEFLS